LTDAKGRRVDFRNSIIVMTSNAGAELIKRDMSLGFAAHVDSEGKQQVEYEKMKEKVLGEMKKIFRPEFLNRIDATVVFHALNKEHIRQIVDLMLNEVVASLQEKNVTLEVTDEARDFIGNKGYDPVFGARPLRRTIQNLVEDQLSEALLRGEFLSGDTVVVDCVNEEIVMKPLVKETT
jgi:ATP-dependent Clp protease ATP-binding subunit ClpC